MELPYKIQRILRNFLKTISLSCSRKFRGLNLNTLTTLIGVYMCMLKIEGGAPPYLNRVYDTLYDL
jgi:hypothetical protein